METERIALSQRERDRLRVLHEIRQKQITQREASQRLKVSDRQLADFLRLEPTPASSDELVVRLLTAGFVWVRTHDDLHQDAEGHWSKLVHFRVG